MIVYVTGTDLWLHPKLTRTMLQDQKERFPEVADFCIKDTNFFEKTYYNFLRSIYVIVASENGNHAGSMRILPKKNYEKVPASIDKSNLKINSVEQTFWECTQLCLSPTAAPNTINTLFAGAGRLMQEFCISYIFTVFDEKMAKNFSISKPIPLLGSETDFNNFSNTSGHWIYKPENITKLMNCSMLGPLEYELAIANSPLLPKK